MRVTTVGRKKERIFEMFRMVSPSPKEATNPAAIRRTARRTRPNDLSNTFLLMTTAEVPDARTSAQKRYGSTRSKGSMHNIISRKIGNATQDAVNSVRKILREEETGFKTNL